MKSPKRTGKTSPTPAKAAKKKDVAKAKTATRAKSPAKKTAKKTVVGKAVAKAAVKTAAKVVKKAAAKAVKKTAKKTVKKAVSKKTAAKKPAAKAPAKSQTKSARPVVKSVAAKLVKAAAKVAETIGKKNAKAAPAKTGKTPEVAGVPKATPRAAKKSAARGTAKASGKTAAKPAARPGKSSLKKSPAPPALPGRKATAPARRPRIAPQPEVAYDFGFPDGTPELPDGYGEDRLVLMTKDPEYLFAYWEVTPERRAEAEKTMRPGEEYREALRLVWSPRALFDTNYTLIPVSLEARKWYLRAPFSGISYQVEIGWLGSRGHFISLLLSNPSDAPESWNATRRRLKRAGKPDGIVARMLETGAPQGSSGLSSAPGLPALPADWDFPGPGAGSSSLSGKSGPRKPGSRG